MTNNQIEIDVKNLRFYARMAERFKWQTDIIDSSVVTQTLNEIAGRMGAAGSAPQPRCPECGGTDLRWSNGRTILFCYNGKPYPEHSFDVSTVESFWKFFAPAPAQEPPNGEYSCAVCGMGMVEPCEHWKAMAAQPVENSSRCAECGDEISSWQNAADQPYWTHVPNGKNHDHTARPISGGASAGELPLLHIGKQAEFAVVKLMQFCDCGGDGCDFCEWAKLITKLALRLAARPSEPSAPKVEPQFTCENCVSPDVCSERMYCDKAGRALPERATETASAPQWYTKEELHDALIARNYEPKIADELASWFADQLELAYKKGMQHSANPSVAGQ